MARLLNLEKSPCLSNPEMYGLECENIRCDKNLEPCASCNLPSRYDDRVSFGVKRFADQENQKTGVSRKSKKADYLNDLAREAGYYDANDFISKLRSDGYSYDRIADTMGVSRRSIQRRCLKVNDGI